MRATVPLAPEDSISRAAALLRSGYAPIVPVVGETGYVGVVTEQCLMAALESGMEPTDPVNRALVDVPTIAPYALGADALRLFESTGELGLAVCDDFGRVVGVLAPSDLFGERSFVPAPASVGGMATPLGIYLASGSVRAGASGLALALTGALLFTSFVLASIITFWVGDSMAKMGPAWVVTVLQGVLPSVLFLAALRFLPISGIHGAEHKVVHAIERGEELVPSVVRRMPRIHPRCGTNIAVGATLFLGIATSTAIPDQTLRVVIAAAVTLFFWRRLGAFVQKWITTREPTDKQLESAIKVGKELVRSYRHSRFGTPSFLRRLANSGVFYVMGGSLVAYAVTAAVLWSLGYAVVL